MRAIGSLSVALSLALGGFLAAACGGAVDPGSTGGNGGGGGSSSGFSGSSSGPSEDTSSSGVSSSSSSGGPAPSSPQCAGVPLPDLALICPDGSAAAAYNAWDGTKCVAAFQCPPGGSSSGAGSSSGVSASSSSGVSASSSSGGYIEPPPVCDFALPDICEACDNGETICAHYAIQNGTCVVEICPPSIAPVGSTCEQGATCSPSTGCATSASSSSDGCSESCTCDVTGHYQCSQTCAVSPPPPSVCGQDQACIPGTACASGPDVYGCDVNCTCTSSTGTFDCSYLCGFGAMDAGSAEDAMPIGL